MSVQIDFKDFFKEEVWKTQVRLLKETELTEDEEDVIHNGDILHFTLDKEGNLHLRAERFGAIVRKDVLIHALRMRRPVYRLQKGEENLLSLVEKAFLKEYPRNLRKWMKIDKNNCLCWNSVELVVGKSKRVIFTAEGPVKDIVQSVDGKVQRLSRFAILVKMQELHERHAKQKVNL